MPDIADPFAQGLNQLCSRIQQRQIDVVSLIEHCLERIQHADPQLRAFEYLDATGAREQARLWQHRLSGNLDCGPLAGVPIAIKDIYAVSGMPVTNGSLHSASHLNGPEGTLVARLRRAGCIILGKTRTVEFALGATGVNEARGTPWNPADLRQQRIPGGSSSGSGVAVAARMCAFALGSDTGGSIRIPACFNGIVGFKPTVGRWPTDGIFPLSPTLDSAGPLCHSVTDARWLNALISGEAAAEPPDLSQLRFGIPRTLFLDELDETVQKAFELACARLATAGARISEFDLPEALERETLFPQIVPAELLSALGREHFLEHRQEMDSVTRDRAAAGLTTTATEYLQAIRRHQALCRQMENHFGNFDAWLTPTCPFEPMTIASLDDPSIHRRSLLASRNTQPVNLFGQCALSMPIGHLRQTLPVGLQIISRAHSDTRLLAIAASVEQELGRADCPAMV